MGVYDGDSWSAEVQQVLRNAYERYPRLAANSFDSQFEIVMIHYDPIFQSIVGKWQSDAGAIGELAGNVARTEVDTLVGWLRNAGGASFIWTHAADVLLYRLSATVRERVKIHVARQIVEGVAQQYDEHDQSRWSVIAHSLGTAVAHDALDMLATGKVPGMTVSAFDPTVEQAQAIVMIANTSRVLETVDVYDSAVKPGTAGQAGRNCLRFLNFRHFLDPFTIPQMFHPQAWPDAATALTGRYSYKEITHVHQANVHDICHYLASPAVHVPVLRALAGKGMIPLAQENEAVRAFPEIGSFSPSAVARLKSDLAADSPGMGQHWPALRKIWDDFHAILRARGEE